MGCIQVPYIVTNAMNSCGQGAGMVQGGWYGLKGGEG